MYMKWTPNVFSDMYCDDFNEMGVFYWYSVVDQHLKRMESKKS